MAHNFAQNETEKERKKKKGRNGKINAAADEKRFFSPLPPKYVSAL